MYKVTKAQCHEFCCVARLCLGLYIHAVNNLMHNAMHLCANTTPGPREC